MDMLFENDTAESRLAKTFFIVEATSCEQHLLWREYHKKVEWNQHIGGPSGWLITVGTDNKRPCCITTNWVIINGLWIMFWYNCSNIINQDKTEKWLEKNFKGKHDGRRSSCDAMNFHNCIHAIKDHPICYYGTCTIEAARENARKFAQQINKLK